MKIVSISDVHNQHRKLNIPDGDVIINAGDISFKGEMNIIQDFADWMSHLPFKHKITISGNHELNCSKPGEKRSQMLEIFKSAGILYLEDSGIEIDNIKFWGSPATPWFHNWEWNYKRGAEIAEKWKLIPDDTNVLITHGPPYGILDLIVPDGNSGRDLHQGCEELTKRVKQLSKLKAHIFGHLHLSGGKSELHNGTLFVNAAVCTEQYIPSNKPMVFDIE